MAARAFFVIAAVSLIAPTLAAAGEEYITPDTIVWLYEARQAKRVPDDQLARVLSPALNENRLSDEFERREAIASAKPKIAEHLAWAKAVKPVKIQTGTRTLGDYDFGRKAFATGWHMGTIFPTTKWEFTDKRAYVIMPTNPADIMFLPMSEVRAKELLGATPGRRVDYVLHGVLTGTKVTTSWDTSMYGGQRKLEYKTVLVRITQVDVISLEDPSLGREPTLLFSKKIP